MAGEDSGIPDYPGTVELLKERVQAVLRNYAG